MNSLFIIFLFFFEIKYAQNMKENSDMRHSPVERGDFWFILSVHMYVHLSIPPSSQA